MPTNLAHLTDAGKARFPEFARIIPCKERPGRFAARAMAGRSRVREASGRVEPDDVVAQSDRRMRLGRATRRSHVEPASRAGAAELGGRGPRRSASARRILRARARQGAAAFGPGFGQQPARTRSAVAGRGDGEQADQGEGELLLLEVGPQALARASAPRPRCRARRRRSGTRRRGRGRSFRGPATVASGRRRSAAPSRQETAVSSAVLPRMIAK